MNKKIGRLYKVVLFVLLSSVLCSCGKKEKKEEYVQTMAQAKGLTGILTITPTAEPVAMPTGNPETELTATPTSEPVATLTSEPETTPTPTPIPEPSPTPVVVNPLDGAYWREVYADNTAELLTKKEIMSLNEKNFKATGTNLVKLSELEKPEAIKVLQMIESYSFPKMKYYDNREITSAEKEAIYKARNLEALQAVGRVEPAYGIVIQNTDLRSFPTEKCLTTSANGRYDYLQETVLLLNEAVIVLHTSSDGEWCFVQAENYYGWISEASIAFCSKESMNEWYETMLDTENEKVLLVTKNSVYETDEGPLALRMGTRLLYEEGEDGEIAVVLPRRDEEKKLKKKMYSVKIKDGVFDESFHRGYLPYTRNNIVMLATELLDTPYAWGDALPFGKTVSSGKEIGMDCSSTVSAVYRCFGFVMPRNTGAQRNMACAGENVTDYTPAKRYEMLDCLEAGALLYSPGHVMLYLGTYMDEYYILHNTTTEFLADGTEEAYYRCVITTMGLGKKGKTITEQLLEMKVLE